ncbi:hypothetical protein D9M69_482710 [compost metagenome]
MVGHDYAVGAEFHRVAGVVRVEDALDHHRAVPEVADPLEVLPGDRRVEVGAQPADVVGQAGRVAAVGGDVAEVVRLAEQADVERPARVGHGLQHAAHGGVRAAHPGMRVAVAGAGHRHVDGEHQGGHPGGLGALQGVAHEAAVFQHVELEPHRPVDGRRDFLDWAHRHGGQGEGHALARRRPRCLHLAAARVHAGQADRGEGHRHRQGLAEQLGLQAQLGHVLQHALAQGNAGQVFDVALERVFGIGAAVDVVEQEGRQPTLGSGAVVGRGRDDHGRLIDDGLFVVPGIRLGGVVPAKAGTQKKPSCFDWIPAFAGMTGQPGIPRAWKRRSFLIALSAPACR